MTVVRPLIAWTVCALAVVACGDDSSAQLELATASLDELLAATPPDGRTPGSNQAIAALVRDQFASVGVTDVTIEEFSIPVSAATAHSLTFGGAPEIAGPVEHTVNVFGGAGMVESAQIIDVGLSTQQMPAAAGKVGLIEFSVTRSLRTQYRNVVASGAVGAIIDSKIDALRQRNVWTLAGANDIDGPIPIVTIEQGPAAAIREQLMRGTDVRVDLATNASVSAMRAYNVIARIPGTKYPERTLVINAHLDSWYAGAADDGQAVAALVVLAKAFVEQPLPYTVELIALDCEETFLLGSNNYVLRRLPDVRDTLVGAISMEMLAPKNVELTIATSDPKDIWSPAFAAGGLDQVFELQLTPGDQMLAFGGEVPSDQGTFWQFGIPGFFVVSTYNEYHTRYDDASNTDPERYAQVLAALEKTVREVTKLPPETLGTRPASSIEVVPQITTRMNNRISGTATAAAAHTQEPIAEATVTLTLYNETYDNILASTIATATGGGAYTFTLDHNFTAGTAYVLAFDAQVSGVASGRAILRIP